MRQQARELSREEILSPKIQQLIEFMRETMRDAPGVGLAAPQIGESFQLAVIEDRAEYHRELTSEQLAQRERKPIPFHVIINPRLTVTGGDFRTFFEGCLSISGYTALVSRAHSAAVTCWNEHAEETTIKASGWYARILQHEIDHLHGILYVDRMKSRTFITLENARRLWKDLSAQEIQSRLGPK